MIVRGLPGCMLNSLILPKNTWLKSSQRKFDKLLADITWNRMLYYELLLSKEIFLLLKEAYRTGLFSNFL